MSEKTYLHFLILCGILCEGIIASLTDEDTRESLDFLVRKRRVITHFLDRLTPTPIDQANYMVNIKYNNRAHCAGAILSHYTVITAAPCVNMHISSYLVYCGHTYENRGSVHNVISKDVHYGNLPHGFYDGVALITVEPPIAFGRRLGHINLHVGYLAPGTRVTVSGWGGSYPAKPGPIRDARNNVVQRALRSITLPIMNRRDCQQAYRGEFNVTEKFICTYDENQYCARTDAGAPLVFNNMLVGIYVWKAERRMHRNPEVFTDLQRDEYSVWIRRNTLLM